MDTQIDTMVDIAKINTLHELLATALRNLETVESDPRHAAEAGVEVNRGELCLPANNTRKVCLTEAMLTVSGGLSIEKNANGVLEELDTAVRLRMQALDQLQRGYLNAAWDSAMRWNDGVLDIKTALAIRGVALKWWREMRFDMYLNAPVKFKKLMWEMQLDLEELGV